MRYSDDPSCVAFLKTYDDTPVCDRKQIPLEAVALKASVNIPQLLGAIVLCFRSYQAQKVAIKAMSAHPAVLQATILNAGMPNGEADRRMLHTALGFLPSPKGASFNFNFGDRPAREEPETEEVSADVNDIFPTINQKQEIWQGHRQKLLEGTH